LTLLFATSQITALTILQQHRSRIFQAASSSNNDDLADNDNLVTNSLKSLYEKVFFYGLDKSSHLHDSMDRSKVKRISNELNQHEKPNPFFTKSEQIASAFIKEKNSPRGKKKYRPINTTEERLTPPFDDGYISILQQRLLSLENQLKVIEITEISLKEDIDYSDTNNNQELVELLTEKEELQSEMNSIQADIITRLATAVKE
jgi:hypothetical protein